MPFFHLVQKKEARYIVREYSQEHPKVSNVSCRYHEISGHMATEGTGTEKETFSGGDFFETKGGHKSPSHEFQVEVHGGVGESRLFVTTPLSLRKKIDNGRGISLSRFFCYLAGSMSGAKSAILGPSFPLAFLSQPTDFGHASWRERNEGQWCGLLRARGSRNMNPTLDSCRAALMISPRCYTPFGGEA